MTATMRTGERYELRVTFMGRVPIEADTFVPPYLHPAAAADR